MKIRVGYGLGTTSGIDGFWPAIDAGEALGWDSVWLSERVTGPIPDTLAALAAVAGRTRRMKFGMSVLVLPGRNPVLLAKELATIDVLSSGRLICAFGLGADGGGRDFNDEQAFMVARKDRAAIADEATRLMIALWTSREPVTFEGRFFTVRDLRIEPKPVQDPYPDVWFGGHSLPALRRVGRIGTGWLPSFVSPDEYAAKAATVREVAAEHGREIDEEHFGALVPYVRDGDERANALLALVRARRPETDPSEVIAVGGDEVLRERLERFVDAGASKFVVVPAVEPSDWGDELARVRETVVRPLEN